MAARHRRVNHAGCQDLIPSNQVHKVMRFESDCIDWMEDE